MVPTEIPQTPCGIPGISVKIFSLRVHNKCTVLEFSAAVLSLREPIQTFSFSHIQRDTTLLLHLQHANTFFMPYYDFDKYGSLAVSDLITEKVNVDCRARKIRIKVQFMHV